MGDQGSGSGSKPDSSAAVGSRPRTLAMRLDRLVEMASLEERRGVYLRSRWRERVLHMADRAGKNRFWFYALRGAAVGGSVFVPPLAALEWKVPATILSLAVAVIVGLTELMRFGPRWRLYQDYVGRTEREGWQLIQLGGPYQDFETHEDAFPTFVERVEGLIRAFEEEYVREVVVIGRTGSEAGEPDDGSD